MHSRAYYSLDRRKCGAAVDSSSRKHQAPVILQFFCTQKRFLLFVFLHLDVPMFAHNASAGLLVGESRAGGQRNVAQTRYTILLCNHGGKKKCGWKNAAVLFLEVTTAFCEKMPARTENST